MLADIKLECLSGSVRIYPVRTYPLLVFAGFHFDSGVMGSINFVVSLGQLSSWKDEKRRAVEPGEMELIYLASTAHVLVHQSFLLAGRIGLDWVTLCCAVPGCVRIGQGCPSGRGYVIRWVGVDPAASRPDQTIIVDVKSGCAEGKRGDLYADELLIGSDFNMIKTQEEYHSLSARMLLVSS